jgi:hypothetical protein
MNKTNIKQHLRRGFSALVIISALAFGAALTLPKALAGPTPSPTPCGGYGPGALYQIEFVSGDNGASWAPVGQRGAAAALSGGGQWLWFALYPDGSADYAGSDCLTGLGSYADNSCISGDAHWKYSSGSITGPNGTVIYTGKLIVISKVVLNGFKFLSNLLGCPSPSNPCDPSQVYFCYTSTTITVPAAYGNYKGTAGSFEPPPKIIVNCAEVDAFAASGGTSLVQVAP